MQSNYVSILVTCLPYATLLVSFGESLKYMGLHVCTVSILSHARFPGVIGKHSTKYFVQARRLASMENGWGFTQVIELVTTAERYWNTRR